MDYKPVTIHTIRVPVETWEAIFMEDQFALVLEDDRLFEAGHWLDLKRSSAGTDMPMFACDGVEQQLWVKITHIIGGATFQLPNHATPADLAAARAANMPIPPLRPLDPRFLIVSFRRIK
jgi:hypothetical protein